MAPPSGQNPEPPDVRDEQLPHHLAVGMAEMFRSLADPTRVKIVYELVHREMTTSSLAALLGVNPPAISQHLRLLRALRIVKPRRLGQQVFYSLDDDHVRLLINFSLSHLQEEREPAFHSLGFAPAIGQSDLKS